MPRSRRRFIHNQAMFITSRVGTGLPFICDPLIERILKGVVAKAQHLYPVEVNALLFMGNHYHMVAICNPDTLDSFMEYLNGEAGKCVNRLRGVCGVNVWSSRYCAQPILTPEDVIEKIAYLYANPVQAHLVDTVEQYPGFSTYKMYRDSQDKEAGIRWIRSSYLSKITQANGNLPKITREVDKLLKDEEDKREYTLELSPFAWMRCFEECSDWDEQEARERIDTRLTELCDEIRKKRIAAGKKVVGVAKLKKQHFHTYHTPKSYGRRALCICHDRELREVYKEEFALFTEQCRTAWEAWKRGDFRANYPPGALRPATPILANALAQI